VDWRKLDGFTFNFDLRFGPADGLPESPTREVKALLEEKIGGLRVLLLEAEELFDPVFFDANEAEAQRADLLGSG
jgi:hypothetical protein